MTKITDWHGAYDQSWQGIINDEAMSHPAKFSRALIWRIFDHLLDQGWLQPGDSVIDPFGGVGLGAEPAVMRGLNYVGVELEQRFVDLGAGCDCTGISKADWIRFYGRWDRANYKDGRHWCPACLAQAKAVVDESPEQFGLFGPTHSATYRRNSGRIPFTIAHRYQGNIDLFHKRPEAKGRAVLAQGDSRRLVDVVAQAGGVVGSPPYAGDSGKADRTGHQRAERRAEEKGFRQGLGCFKTSEAYGTTPGQLGAMPEGRPVVVSSPPYANDTVNSRNGIDPAKIGRHGKNSQALKMDGYGEAAGQLSNLPPGDVSAVVSSPPWAGNSGGRGEASRNGIDPALFDRHQGGMVGGIGGPGNLAGLEPGEVESVIGGIVSSPPFGGQEQHTGGFTSVAVDSRTGKQRSTSGMPTRDGYGVSPGQLGAMPINDNTLLALLSNSGIMQTKENVLCQEKELSTDVKIAESKSAGEAGGVNPVPGSTLANPSRGERNQMDSEKNYQGPNLTSQCPTTGESSISTGAAGMTGGEVTPGESSAAQPSKETDIGVQPAEQPTDSKSITKRAKKKPAESGTTNLITSKPCALPATLPGTEENSMAQLARAAESNTGQEGPTPIVPNASAQQENRPNEDSMKETARFINASSVDGSSSTKTTDISTVPQSVPSQPEQQNKESTSENPEAGPDTFWAAAKTIVLQCAAILPPGAPAVWVVKSFVRSGVIVDFPGQWQALCEACGFETVEIVRAWLVKDKGTQIGLNGEAVRKTVSRKSFFRRLSEKNGAPAIDFETVLFTKRSEAAQ